ncbi:HipA domain-containing protein [uncultured Bacteroides sp.]|uniref:HipA domain-containing protein n=1 Tax=uncultured Bacteroides sp. TaxID=162156 RepID=UPI002AA8EAF1|nr:HipA domain-containing protein [uncultured Bacteroides sp.]
MRRCLYCYKELEENEVDFHPSCAKKIFGTPAVPELPYTREQIAELAGQVVRSRTTLTGVQAKLSLDIEKAKEEPQRFTIVGLWGRYILKPQTDLFEHLPELEDVTMHLAEIAKVKAVPHSLIRFADGELCYITKRIDRDNKGKKFPMEDMCQLAEKLTEYKYRGSYEQIAKLVIKYSAAPKLDAINFWEQVLFSWLTGNADMHLKNFSLYATIMGRYTLTPAYDMLSTALVMPEDTEELALTLSGKKRKIKKSDFIAAFKASELEAKAIENMFARFQRAVPKWMEFIDISFLPQEMKDGFKEIISQRISMLK